jgi:hypothetical protein
MYNLTPSQQELLRWIVGKVRAKEMPEEFTFMWGTDGGFLHYKGARGFDPATNVTEGALDALAANHLLHIRTRPDDKFGRRYCTLTGKAYEAVDSNFAAPDTSFFRHLTPLADITALDTELKHRCLPILGAGAADPKLWDSAVRTAGVILEERIRDVGMITDKHAVGRDVVNKVFRKGRTLADKFAHDAEREGYRDLYAGVVGAFRNPSAHRLVDPAPHEGGAYIVFVNLLLEMLDDLRVLNPRVNYDETTQIIGIFKNAPRVKVAIAALSSEAGEQFRPVMECAAWLNEAFQKAGVDTQMSLWENPENVPDGTNIFWIKNPENNDMVCRIIKAAEVKGLYPREIARPVSKKLRYRFGDWTKSL